MAGQRLADRTWPELASGPAPLLAVPLGSCEQHGPHLPLDTDARIALALADRLAAARRDVLVAPPLAYGASWEHAGFAGLLSFDATLLTSLLVELGRSADWAAGVVFVNGHGGNLLAAREAATRLRAESRRVLAWAPRVPGGDAHAGHTETSLMLAIEPGSVRIAPAAAGWTGALDEVWERGVAAVSPNGVLGDPTRASAAQGAALFDAMADDLVAAVGRMWP